MLFKDLVLVFVRDEADKLIFKTAAGAEVIFSKEIFGELDFKAKKLYCTLNDQAIAEQDKKQALNELLNEE